MLFTPTLIPYSEPSHTSQELLIPEMLPQTLLYSIAVLFGPQTIERIPKGYRWSVIFPCPKVKVPLQNTRNELIGPEDPGVYKEPFRETKTQVPNTEIDLLSNKHENNSAGLA